MIKKTSISLLGLVLISSAFAQEAATVLPKGISRTRFVTVFAFPVTHQYDNNGNRAEIMAPLNTTVPIKTQATAAAASGKPELKALYDKVNLLEDGLADQLFQTRLSAQGSLDVQQYVAAYEYGITSKLSLGIIVPVVSYQAQANFSATNESQIQAVIDRKIKPMGAAGDPFAKNLKLLADNLPSQAVFEAAVFTSKGYIVPNRSSGSGLGDVEAGVKYHVADFAHWSSTIQTGFRLPTSTMKKNYADLLSQASGDHQLDYGLQNQNDFYLTPSTTLGVSNKITVQFAATEFRPVPSPGQTGLTDLTNPNNFDRVHKDLGDMLDSEVSLSQSFAGKRLNTYVAYQYYLKSQDAYSGHFSNLDYGALQSDTNAYAHYIETGIGVTTVPSVIAHTLKVPMEMKISFNKKLAGKNSPDVTYTRFDFILYF